MGSSGTPVLYIGCMVTEGELTGFCIRDAVCLLSGTTRIFKYDSEESVTGERSADSVAGEHIQCSKNNLSSFERVQSIRSN